MAIVAKNVPLADRVQIVNATREPLKLKMVNVHHVQVNATLALSKQTIVLNVELIELISQNVNVLK